MLTQEKIDVIIEEMEKDPRVQGILLTGSYVYGVPNEKSDLDVRCITNDGSNWAEFDRERFDTRIEVFFNPPDVVRAYMLQSKKEGHGDCIHFWGNGKIIYDPNGIIAQLQNEARQLWREGPEHESTWAWRHKKHRGHAKREW